MDIINFISKVLLEILFIIIGFVLAGLSFFIWGMSSLLIVIAIYTYSIYPVLIAIILFIFGYFHNLDNHYVFITIASAVIAKIIYYLFGINKLEK